MERGKITAGTSSFRDRIIHTFSVLRTFVSTATCLKRLQVSKVKVDTVQHVQCTVVCNRTGTVLLSHRSE